MSETSPDLVGLHLAGMDIKAVVKAIQSLQVEIQEAHRTPEKALAFEATKADTRLAVIIGIGEYIEQRVLIGMTPDSAMNAALKKAVK